MGDDLDSPATRAADAASSSRRAIATAAAGPTGSSISSTARGSEDAFTSASTPATAAATRSRCAATTATTGAAARATGTATQQESRDIVQTAEAVATVTSWPWVALIFTIEAWPTIAAWIAVVSVSKERGVSSDSAEATGAMVYYNADPLSPCPTRTLSLDAGGVIKARQSLLACRATRARASVITGFSFLAVGAAPTAIAATAPSASIDAVAA